MVFPTIFSGSAVALVFKNLIGRARPSYQLMLDTGFSFPSGHTMCLYLFTLAVVTSFIMFNVKSPTTLVLDVGLVVLVLLVVLSRVYLRDHYPSDILASILLANVIYGCSLFILRGIRQSNE